MKALWLSGGKDSVACLLLNRDRLDAINVLWANTGKYLPEHLEWMKTLKAMCPNWYEVKTNRDAQNEKFGLPADVVPVRCTDFGAKFSGAPEIKVQSYLQCCHENLSGPLWTTTKQLGAKTVICGQRADEAFKAPRKNGDVIDGVRFEHPIEDWTSQQVMDYMKLQIDVPGFYELEHSSIDCFDCTAYLDHSEDRAAYLKRHHPEKHKILIHRLGVLRSAMDADLNPMQRILANG